MNILTVIPEKLKTAARTLYNGQGTATGDYKGIKPAGAESVMVLCLITMANAADLVLTMVTADDADGASPVALAENVPIFKDDVRQTDAKTLTVADDSGSFVVVFNVPAGLVPDGKFLCLQYGNSNAANILSAIAIEDALHESG